MNMTTPTNEEVRRQFEAWAVDHHQSVERDREHGYYVDDETHAAWLGYQAALSIPAVVALVEALRPFVDATLTTTGQVIGLMREDFDKARAALAPFTTGAGHE